MKKLLSFLFVVIFASSVFASQDSERLPITFKTRIPTVEGFSALNINSMKYTKLGSLVYVVCQIYGTSLAWNFSFDLPYRVANNLDQRYIPIMVRDNGSVQNAPGALKLNAGLSTAEVFLNLSEAGFTASQKKGTWASFWYETDQ